MTANDWYISLHPYLDPELRDPNFQDANLVDLMRGHGPKHHQDGGLENNIELNEKQFQTYSPHVDNIYTMRQNPHQRIQRDSDCRHNGTEPGKGDAGIRITGPLNDGRNYTVEPYNSDGVVTSHNHSLETSGLEKNRTCENCGTRTTSRWQGRFCNACHQYKMHRGSVRPRSLWGKDALKRTRRTGVQKTTSKKTTRVAVAAPIAETMTEYATSSIFGHARRSFGMTQTDMSGNKFNYSSLGPSNASINLCQSTSPAGAEHGIVAAQRDHRVPSGTNCSNPVDLPVRTGCWLAGPDPNSESNIADWSAAGDEFDIFDVEPVEGESMWIVNTDSIKPNTHSSEVVRPGSLPLGMPPSSFSIELSLSTTEAPFTSSTAERPSLDLELTGTNVLIEALKTTIPMTPGSKEAPVDVVDSVSPSHDDPEVTEQNPSLGKNTYRENQSHNSTVLTTPRRSNRICSNLRGSQDNGIPSMSQASSTDIKIGDIVEVKILIEGKEGIETGEVEWIHPYGTTFALAYLYHRGTVRKALGQRPNGRWEWIRSNHIQHDIGVDHINRIVPRQELSICKDQSYDAKLISVRIDTATDQQQTSSTHPNHRIKVRRRQIP